MKEFVQIAIEMAKNDIKTGATILLAGLLVAAGTIVIWHLMA